MGNICLDLEISAFQTLSGKTIIIKQVIHFDYNMTMTRKKRTGYEKEMIAEIGNFRKDNFQK